MTMASKLSPLCNFFLLLMLFSYSPSLASSSTSPSTICNSTPHPSFCKSNLPPNEFNTIQDYGWYFIHQSLSSAKDFLLLIKSYPISHSSYSKRTVHALKDCQLLADLTVDFLSKTLRTISSTNSLNSLQAEDLHTLLSATLTNQETCSDGLLELASDSSVKKGMLGPLSNGTKLHSISLALFKHGWVPKTKRESFPTERNHLLFSNMENIINGLLPLRMSITGRRLLQTTLGDVLVSQTVLVNPDGSGDFTTINDAVAAAPENTDISDGYFVIYIVPGVYYEYVSIDKNKQYLMMVGYGINQTVITGDHNQKDDLSTFDSATFAVVFQDCNIYLRLPLHGQYNVITAQGKTDPNQNTGTSIHLCSIRAAEELNGTETYLGRPWKEYSTAVYIQSFMDSLINFEGWHTWNDTDFAINTLYYGEYDNNGPGSDTSNRVTWPGYHVMNRDEANDFNVSHFIQGDEWLPATGVPYTGGLL
ncbi:probable pectinesterase/pectinesterase inhibitor 41 isoform X2 [Quercus robur]|uniref:probable pectinesterase/pectinesterase inhibitor 41 isoform X2 n=1 Tax=Quercus robur TaxID=38942 RepID=UPI0021619816|nr:probable pectinesterase/pectinesterase inhibitor 41 isoform X2 [Quercus robur]